MIEIRIEDDLAQYIDTEELQKSAENEVKYQIIYIVDRIIKSDNFIQKMLDDIVTKMIRETEFSDDIKQLIQKRVFESITQMSDFDIQYKSKIGDAFEEITASRDEEIHKILSDKIDNMLSKYEVEKYIIDSSVIDIMTNKILEESTNSDLKEKLTMFIRNGLDRIMEQVSY